MLHINKYGIILKRISCSTILNSWKISKNTVLWINLTLISVKSRVEDMQEQDMQEQQSIMYYPNMCQKHSWLGLYLV